MKSILKCLKYEATKLLTVKFLLLLARKRIKRHTLPNIIAQAVICNI